MGIAFSYARRRTGKGGTYDMLDLLSRESFGKAMGGLGMIEDDIVQRTEDRTVGCTCTSRGR